MYFQDSYGDGMCCQFGDGSYLLSTENLILAQGGTFASVDTSEFCIELDVNSTAPVDTTCDAVFTHDALSTGAVPYSPPSTFVFSENGIDLGFNEFFTGTGMMYGSAAISNAIPEVGDGLVLTLSNINAVYNFGAFPGVQEVSFVFFDGAGIENLEVNGYLSLIHISEPTRPY